MSDNWTEGSWSNGNSSKNLQKQTNWISGNWKRSIEESRQSNSIEPRWSKINERLKRDYGKAKAFLQQTPQEMLHILIGSHQV